MSYKFWHPFFSVQYSEYAGGSHLSTSGDVYSFGVVLMEILTGKRPTDPLFCNGFSIINFCKTSFPGQILDIVDAHLLEEYQDSARANRQKRKPSPPVLAGPDESVSFLHMPGPWRPNKHERSSCRVARNQIMILRGSICHTPKN